MPEVHQWRFCVACVWNGKARVISPWFGAKHGAECELDQMGRSMNYVVVSGRAFILRKLVVTRRREESCMIDFLDGSESEELFSWT